MKNYVTVKEFIRHQTGMADGRYYDITDEDRNKEWRQVVLRIEKQDGQDVIRLYQHIDGKETVIEQPERILDYLTPYKCGMYATPCRW